MPEQIKDILCLFLEEVKRVLKGDLSKLIIYGSYARGDFNEHSDVDVMILTSLSEAEIKLVSYELYDIAFDFFMEYGVDISVIVKNEEHFVKWLDVLPFYRNVTHEGITLYEV